MDKEQIIEKLSDLGIITTNAYPKASFVASGDVHVALFKRELAEDFYFFNSFDKKIYKIPKISNIDTLEKDTFKGATKFLVPIHMCSLIWEDKEYVELNDDQYSAMTLRDFACIQLRYPGSNKEWLNTLINESNNTGTVSQSN